MEEGSKDEVSKNAELEAQLALYQELLTEIQEEEEEENRGGEPEEEEKPKKPEMKPNKEEDERPLLNQSQNSSLGLNLSDRRGTPPPPMKREDEPDAGVIIDMDKSHQGDRIASPTEKTSFVDGGIPPNGRISPGGRTSPFKNRVEPIDENGEIVNEKGLGVHHPNKNNNLQTIFKSQMQAFDNSRHTSNGVLSTPDSGVDSLGSDKRSSVKTISDTEKVTMNVKEQKPQSKVFVRTFKQRASQENFALYGLLTPALCLVPKVDGNDALTQTFTELKGQDRELKLAAAHIDDAISGRGKYGKARAFFKSKQGRWCFKMLNSKKFKYVVLLMATMHLILTFFEPPTSQYVPTSPAILVLTALCLLVYTLDVGVHIGFLSWSVFWSLDENRWIRREFIFVCMYYVDYLMLVIEVIIGPRLAQPFRCLRAAIILCKLNNVQHIYDVVMSIVIKLGKVFFIIVIFIILFSAVGVHLYDDIYRSIPSSSSNCTGNETNIYVGAFDHVGITFLRLFVLLSTENYPDFMIPAYASNQWNFLYFGIFLFVGVFFLTAIMLAIIVDSYWDFAKKHVKKERARERAELAKAWNLMDPLGTGSLPINDGRFMKLLKILKPHHTDEMNLQLIDYLDENDDGQVDSLEWTIRLNEALSFEFEEDKYSDMDTTSSHCVYVVRSFAQKIVRSIAFTRFVLILIVIHCILFCLQWHNMDEVARLIIQIMKTTIVSIFVVEMLLRVVSEGRNLIQVVELLDITLILVAVAANIPTYFISPAYYGLCSVISGLAVTFRAGFNSAQTKKALILFFTKVFPVMFDLIILVFIIIFAFSVLGWELFYGIIPDTTYDAGIYEYNCGIGFNSFSCSLLMVFQIVTTSNWHEIMNAAMVATTPWACLYFVSCFTVINLVVMNLFVAIAIEAFNKLGTEKETEKAANVNRTVSQDETFADSAKSFLNNLFESARSEQDKEKVQRPTGSPRMRRPSRVPVILEEEEEEEEEDLSGLSLQERKKRQMKKKREKKKNKFKTMIIVITAFRATKDSELSLNVGEEVTVVNKQDEWWEGKKENDEQGWFPASHVREVKRAPTIMSQLPQQQPLPEQQQQQQPQLTRRTTQDSIKSVWSDKEDTPRSPPGNASMNSSLKFLPTGGLVGGDTINKKPKLKLKNSAGNWRKEILGDITVMNPQELKELNKILKSQHSMNSSLGGSLRRQPTLSESIEEESEPETPPKLETRTSMRSKPPPMISVQRAPTIPLVIEEEPEPNKDDKGAEADDENTLTVEKPELPKDLKKKKNKEQTKNGEMPSWATKFLMSNNIKASADVKFDENGDTEKQSEKPRSENPSTEKPSTEDDAATMPGKVVIEEDQV